MVSIDYYQIEDLGCCLICPNAEPGCLCYSCKCTKCINYLNPEISGEYNEEGEPKGSCKQA